MKRSHLTYGLLTAAVVVGIGASSAAAAIPAANGVISGCYDDKGGELRVIDAETGTTCSTKETTLSWNEHGPAGPAGPQGETGPAGPSVLERPLQVKYHNVDPLAFVAGLENGPHVSTTVRIANLDTGDAHLVIDLYDRNGVQIAKCDIRIRSYGTVDSCIQPSDFGEEAASMRLWDSNRVGAPAFVVTAFVRKEIPAGA